MFKLNLIEGIKNIDKNKFLACLSMILFTFLFILQSYTYSYYSVSNIQKKYAEHESVQNYEVYTLFNKMGSMTKLINYIDPDLKNNLETEIMEYFEVLGNIENLNYVNLFYSEAYVWNFKGDVNIFGVEAQNTSLDSQLTGVQALYCSPTFHKTENYRVIKGRDFTDEDMVYNADKPRAVLLGYKYKDVYEIGDTIEIYDKTWQFLNTATEFEVIGFLAEDSTVLDRFGRKIYDLDTCIVFPTIFMSEEDYQAQDEDVKRVVQNANYLYFESVKFLVNKEHEQAVISEIQSALDNCSKFGKYFEIVNSKQSVEKIHSRTEAVTQFAFNITAVLMVASLVTIVFSVINRIENNLKDYAIHISLGASFNGIIGFVISEMAIILGCSMVLGLTVTKLFLAHLYMPYYFLEFLGIFALTSLLVIILSAITAKLTLKKYDLCTLIK